MGNKSKQLQPAGRQTITQTQIQTAAQIYSGPIPPANEMSRYAQVNPDFPNRIMTMAEQQAEHRQKMDLLDARQKVSALRYAVAISALTLCGGFWCILHDKDTTGLVAIITNLAVLAGTFIYSGRKKG